MPRRKPTTKELNIRARNRANAQKSTGPKSAAGKAKASRNALRHGLAAQRHVDPVERANAEARYGELVAAMRPRDAVETAWIRDIAQALARLDRIDALEAALAPDFAAAEGAPGLPAAAVRRLSGLDRYRNQAAAALRRDWQSLETYRRFSSIEARKPHLRAPATT
jgi:hypothetical protein